MQAGESRKKNPRRRIHKRRPIDQQQSRSSRWDTRERVLHDPYTFFDGNNPVTLKVRQLGRNTAWPENLDCINGRMWAQAKMETRVLSGLIAHAALPLIVKDEISRGYFQSCTNAISIGPRADQQDLQPVVGISSIIAQKLRSLAIVVHENVEVAVIIEVADRGSPAHPRQLKIRP
jgi:hypothetical protein